MNEHRTPPTTKSRPPVEFSPTHTVGRSGYRRAAICSSLADGTCKWLIGPLFARTHEDRARCC